MKELIQKGLTFHSLLFSLTLKLLDCLTKPLNNMNKFGHTQASQTKKDRLYFIFFEFLTAYHKIKIIQKLFLEISCQSCHLTCQIH